VGLVAASIVLDGTVFKDGVDLTPEDFARRLKGVRQLPVTAPVTRGELLEAFRRAAASSDVLAVLCSSGLSKTYEHAVAAVAEGAEELLRARREAGVSGEPVVLTLDSRQSSGPLGLLVTLAARLAAGGLTVQQVAERVADIAARMRTHFMVSSLEYLQHAGAVRPEKLKGRAILHLAGGVLQIVDRVDQAVAMARLVDRAAEGVNPSAPVIATVVHASAPAEASQLRALLEQRLEVVELVERQMGPAVTCHVGPGTVGVGLFVATDQELELLRGNGG
jgi:DegV family protein with EDD domain